MLAWEQCPHLLLSRPQAFYVPLWRRFPSICLCARKWMTVFPRRETLKLPLVLLFHYLSPFLSHNLLLSLVSPSLVIYLFVSSLLSLMPVTPWLSACISPSPWDTQPLYISAQSTRQGAQFVESSIDIYVWMSTDWYRKHVRHQLPQTACK